MNLKQVGKFYVVFFGICAAAVYTQRHSKTSAIANYAPSINIFISEEQYMSVRGSIRSRTYDKKKILNGLATSNQHTTYFFRTRFRIRLAYGVLNRKLVVKEL